jgi:ornithine decarboxylase
MSWLAHAGVGFDCASAREIISVRDLLQTSKRPDILFANPCKKFNDIINASIQKINTTVIDSHEEVDKLVEANWKGDALIRIAVDDTGSTMPFSAKFGLHPSNIKSLANYAALKEIRIAGVSFHVGSGCKRASQYKSAIQEANECLDILNAHSKQKEKATLLDIGGGFSADADLFREAAASIQEACKRLPPVVRVVAEPGRFFAAKSHDLFVQVIGKKPCAANSGYRYTLDESLYGQFSCIPYDHAEPKWIRIRMPGEARRENKPAVLYGRTCDSVDMIAMATAAEELMVGDWLWFPNMGAYTTVTSTEFNGFPKPPLRVLESHVDLQLPDPREMDTIEWPSGCRYASVVKVPEASSAKCRS